MQGHCVRLTKGDFTSLREYSSAPEEVASEFVSAGLRRVHIVDVEGARAGGIVHWATLEAILSVPGLEAQIGGGIRTEETVERLLALGAKQLIFGSVAVHSPETIGLWASKFGPEHFCVAADLNSGFLASSGWTKKENSTIDTILSKLESAGISDYLCTDISRDGTLEGPNFELYRVLVRTHPAIRWIASGGISSMRDLETLRQIGLSAAVVGKALYEGKIQIQELARFGRM